MTLFRNIMLYPPRVFVVSASLPPTLLLLVYNETSYLSLFHFSMPSLFGLILQKLSCISVFLYFFHCVLIYSPLPTLPSFSLLLFVWPQLLCTLWLCVFLCAFTAAEERETTWQYPQCMYPVFPDLPLSFLFFLFLLHTIETYSLPIYHVISQQGLIYTSCGHFFIAWTCLFVGPAQLLVSSDFGSWLSSAHPPVIVNSDVILSCDSLALNCWSSLLLCCSTFSYLLAWPYQCCQSLLICVQSRLFPCMRSIFLKCV